jgi:hypothetical protein
VTARLDWQAFSSRFFPGRARHDFQVLKAYEAYGNRFDAEKRDQPVETEALRIWEGEGGAADTETGGTSRKERARDAGPLRPRSAFPLLRLN